MKNLLPTVTNRDKFFEETSNSSQELLSEFNSIRSSMGMEESSPWKYYPIHDILGVWESAIGSFKSIKENIDSITDYKILTLGLSIYSSDDGYKMHTDDQGFPSNFRRYHLPLQLTENSRLVMHNGQELTWELGNWQEFLGMDITHSPYNPDKEERIVLLMDVLEGEVDKQDVLNYYKDMADHSISTNFEELYNDYV